MENWEYLDFTSFFNERIRERGLNLKKLSEISGIAIKHLEGLSRGDFAKLPSEPYLRGYLWRLGRILNFDPQIWWPKLKEGGSIRNSGGRDLPPKNRFIKPKAHKIFWISGAVLIISLLIGSQAPRIIGKPIITIAYPDKNPATTLTSQINLAGTIKNASGLYINGEVITVGSDGVWKKTVLLQTGINSLKIRAKKFLGGETEVIQQIIYQPTSTPSAIP